jgi:Flp pilus assembly protein TadD
LALEPENAFLHHAMARSEFGRSRFAEAESAILESIRLRPEDAEAHAIHAMILAATGRREAAVDVMGHAKHLGPELRGVRGLEAFLTMPRDAARADQMTRDLVHAEPEGAEEHWLRGLALVQSGRFRDAANHFTRAATLKPASTTFVRAARISRHWIFWPLRVTSPFCVWVAWYIMPVTFIPALFVGGEAWKLFWYSVAYVLYTYTALLAMLALPFTKER